MKAGGTDRWEVTTSTGDNIYHEWYKDGRAYGSSTTVTCANFHDGNWHHYEFYVNFSAGICRFWYDSTLKVERNNGSSWTTNWIKQISVGSLDSAPNEDNVFTRFIDDVEIWDGMPNRTSAPMPPTALRVVN